MGGQWTEFSALVAVKLKNDCPYGSTMRARDEHLFELGLACDYLGSTAQYQDQDAARIIRTNTIGNWLRMASRLEEVKIDAWRFESDLGLLRNRCRPDFLGPGALHAVLNRVTRFAFVMSALQEAYRFVYGQTRTATGSSHLATASVGANWRSRSSRHM